MKNKMLTRLTSVALMGIMACSGIGCGNGGGSGGSSVTPEQKNEEILVPAVAGYSVVSPDKISGNLHNPGMGWITLEETSWEGKTDLGTSGDLEEIDCVGIQDAWGMIEQEKGVFDFSRIDETIDFWVAKGKRINLRIVTDSQTLPETHAGCPTWLFSEEGVGYQEKYNRQAIVTDLTDPVYQFYFERFMQKLSEKYADNPYIETIDLRGYGQFGEWHSGHDFSSYEERIATLSKIIDVYAESFTDKGKVLFLSATFEFDETMTPNCVTKNYEKYYTRQALDYGTTTWDNVSLRRDGYAANIIKYSQDGKFISEFFRSGKNLPIAGEYASGIDVSVDKTYGLDAIDGLDDILYGCHPNYCTVLGWLNSEVARYYDLEGSELIDRGNEKFGYRFAIDSARYPTAVAKNKDFVVTTEISNSAVGRFWMDGYNLTIMLLDDAGNAVYSTNERNFSPRSILNGQSVRYYTTLNVDVPVGKYSLAYAITDSNGSPAIRMAMGSVTEYETKIYKVGEIEVADTVNDLDSVFIKTDRAGLASYDFKQGETYIISFDYTPKFDIANFRYNANYGYTLTQAGREILRFADVTQTKGRKTLTFTAQGKGGITIGSDNFGEIEIENVYIEKYVGYCETFDGYDFSDKDAIYYPLNINAVSITSASGEVISGSASVLLSSLASGFNDLLKIDENVLRLTPGGTYNISFDSLTYGAPSDGSYFYIALINGSSRKIIGEWLDRDDVGIQRYSYTFNVPNTGDYTVAFGVKGVSAVILDNIVLTGFAGNSVLRGTNHASVQNVRKTIIKGLGTVEGFEEEQLNGCIMTPGFNRWGSLTKDPKKVIEGKYSFSSLIEEFSWGHGNDFYEFMYSNPKFITFEKNKTYKIEFDYKLVESIKTETGIDGYGYVLIRSDKLGKDGDKGSEHLSTPILDVVYHKEYIVTVGNADDFYFIIGTYGYGELIVDNVVINKLD